MAKNDVKVGDNPKLKQKKMSDGNLSLYLDYYLGRVNEVDEYTGEQTSKVQRKREFLHLTLLANPRTPLERQSNKDIMALAHKIRFEREQQLKEDKKSFRKKFHKKIPTSKWLIYFLFINCTLIELFTGWVTIKSLQLAAMTYILPDFTPLVTLIGAVVSEVIGFGVYSLKSAKENTTGGIVYETAMMNIKTSNNMANIPIDPNGVG